MRRFDDLAPTKSNALCHLEDMEQCLYSYVRQNAMNLSSKGKECLISGYKKQFDCIRKFIKRTKKGVF